MPFSQTFTPVIGGGVCGQDSREASEENDRRRFEAQKEAESYRQQTVCFSSSNDNDDNCDYFQASEVGSCVSGGSLRPRRNSSAASALIPGGVVIKHEALVHVDASVDKKADSVAHVDACAAKADSRDEKLKRIRRNSNVSKAS